MPRGGQVGSLAIGQQVERLAEGVLDVAEGGLGYLDLPFGLRGLGAQSLLLGAQQVDRHRPGVVGVEKLLALLVHLGETLALAG
ncbi:MAG TPA: hypothetical protein VF731_00985 [Solirubrobacterales bacterium]